jgi:hypothetical protein
VDRLVRHLTQTRGHQVWYMAGVPRTFCLTGLSPQLGA